MSGVLVVDKPLGWSSMDVIRRVRRAAQMRKVGHAGTLDPLATGVVVVCLGKATRAVEQIMGQTKTYEARIDLSAFTTTDDREGERTEPTIAAPPDLAMVEAGLERLTGWIEQRPPAYSAIHVQGQRAYALARRGETVDLPARRVRVDAIDLLDYAWPCADVRIVCGRGTYIRSLARDLGEALGTGGHLASLRRTAVGPYHVDNAVPGDELEHRSLQESDLLPIPEADVP